MEMTIEKGVPAPIRGAKWRAAKYPLAGMEVGDSFFMTGDMHACSRAMETARKYGVRNGRRYISERQDGGVRVWRVE